MGKRHWGIWERSVMVARTINSPTNDDCDFGLLLPPPPSEQLDEWNSVFSELTWEGLEADVYLAFIGAGPLQLSGFLVTAKSSINAVIAHCPVETDSKDPKRSYRDLHKQL